MWTQHPLTSSDSDTQGWGHENQVYQALGAKDPPPKRVKNWPRRAQELAQLFKATELLKERTVLRMGAVEEQSGASHLE